MNWILLIGLWIAGLMMPPLLVPAAIATAMMVFSNKVTEADDETEIFTDKDTNTTKPAGNIALLILIALFVIFAFTTLFGFMEIYNG